MDVNPPISQKGLFNHLASYKLFAFVCVVLLPFWLSVLLPLTLLYLLIKTLFRGNQSIPGAFQEKELQKTSLRPTSTPKGQREFDLIVFGATGFTGSFVCEHLARNYELVIGKKEHESDRVDQKKVKSIFLCRLLHILTDTMFALKSDSFIPK